MHEKNQFVSLHPLKGEELVEGDRRDRIPARKRKGMSGVEKLEIISRFFLDNIDRNSNFVVPKAKKSAFTRRFGQRSTYATTFAKATVVKESYGGQRMFFEIMKYTTRRDEDLAKELVSILELSILGKVFRRDLE